MIANQMTRMDFEALHADLDRLHERYNQIVQKMSEMENRKLADDTPDAFFQLKREQGDVAQRMNYIRQQLSNAVVVNNDDDLDSVSLGNRVKVYDFQNKLITEFDIVASISAEPDARQVTVNSPLGQALIDRENGSLINAETPNGIDRYRIIDILPMPDAN